MIGFSVSVFVPVVIYMIAEKQWWLLFWFEPIKAMKLRNQKKNQGWKIMKIKQLIKKNISQKTLFTDVLAIR